MTEEGFVEGNNGNLMPVPGPGRKSLFKPEYCDQARKLCLLGYTDEELASFFGVCLRTINSWKAEFPAFLHSISEGKDKADADVADSLYRAAVGHKMLAEHVDKDVNGNVRTTTVTKYVPPDPNAAYKWLLNRRRKDWSESKAVTHSGAVMVVTGVPRGDD